MAFEPEDQKQEQTTPEQSLSQPEAGPAQTQVELLDQIAKQLSGLTEQVANINTELLNQKAENAKLREQLFSTTETVSETNTQLQSQEELGVESALKEEMDDDQIQQLLADAETNSSEVITDEENEQLEEATPESESHELQTDTPEITTDDLQLEAKSSETELETRSAMSEDEVASLMEEAGDLNEVEQDEDAAELHLEDPQNESESEAVQEGFTSLHAGKEIDEETGFASAEQSEDIEEEEEVARREVVKASFELEKEVLEKVPAHLAIAALAVPYQVTEEGLICKVATPIDRASLDLIEDAAAMKVITEDTPMEEVLDALRKAYGSPSLGKEREAVIGISPKTYKHKKSKKNFFGRSA